MEPAGERLAPTAPELTVRAIATGMVIGAILTPCNVYSGLKIGWTFNMSVAAGLIGFALWTAAQRTFGAAAFGLKENNINQTAASSAASIISAGLAAPIPALALLTGQMLTWPVLALWMFVISALGVVVAAGLRNQLLYRENLPFPAGIVTGETMREIHDGGPEAAQRLKLLSISALFGAVLKIFTHGFGVKQIALPFKACLGATSSGGAGGTVTAMNLGFALDPSVLMFGFGAISGLRIGISVLIGAVLGWGLLAPLALSRGWANAGDADAVWFGPLVAWLLWPGATLMVTASLASFAISLMRMASARRRTILNRSIDDAPPDAGREAVPRGPLTVAFLVVLVACVAAQGVVFGIGWFEATLAVLLSYVLAIVAARVSGETAITPVGALGKITQLTFGAISPGNVTANLMTANVTGGAAGQCADLMHDLRTGQMIGATPSFQVIAQIFGVLTGSLVAAATYLALIPDPQRQLITPEWPAPAVATWKAVAEVLSEGLSALPPGAAIAIMIAAIAGVLLAMAEKLGPARWHPFVPSAPAMGLAFVIPAWNSLSLFAGALVAALIARWYPKWASRRLVVIAAGLIVGESLAGVVTAMAGVFQ
ncbi:MAG: OPT/YSL family transporter [Alphaproteobacteria bacterium]|nr:OPT/YSL family transporter [Alphaproteobacteria bacterium]